MGVILSVRGERGEGKEELNLKHNNFWKKRRTSFKQRVRKHDFPNHVEQKEKRGGNRRFLFCLLEKRGKRISSGKEGEGRGGTQELNFTSESKGEERKKEKEH